MNRPTVHSIAREAGVSLATVDRVLNARPGVRDQTIAKVLEAVERLGYVRDTSAANLARRRQYRFAFVLPEGPSQFVGTLRAALKEATSPKIADRLTVKVVSIPLHDPHRIVRVLRALDPDKLDGVAIMAPETPQVRDAVVRLKEHGLSVVALVSDLPNSPRDYCVGIDSVAAGRTAGLLMGRFVARQGEVLVATNSLRTRDSVERRLGFDSVLKEDHPHLRALPTVESFDDPARMVSLVLEAAHSRPDLVGIYSMSAGNTQIIEALQKLRTAPRPVVIAHELTPATRAALCSGEIAAIIAQNVGHLVRSALRVLRALSDRSPIYEAQERVRIDVVVRENLP